MTSTLKKRYIKSIKKGLFKRRQSKLPKTRFRKNKRVSKKLKRQYGGADAAEVAKAAAAAKNEELKAEVNEIITKLNISTRRPVRITPPKAEGGVIKMEQWETTVNSAPAPTVGDAALEDAVAFVDESIFDNTTIPPGATVLGYVLIPTNYDALKMFKQNIGNHVNVYNDNIEKLDFKTQLEGIVEKTSFKRDTNLDKFKTANSQHGSVAGMTLQERRDESFVSGANSRQMVSTGGQSGGAYKQHGGSETVNSDDSSNWGLYDTIGQTIDDEPEGSEVYKRLLLAHAESVHQVNDINMYAEPEGKESLSIVFEIDLENLKKQSTGEQRTILTSAYARLTVFEGKQYYVTRVNQKEFELERVGTSETVNVDIGDFNTYFKPIVQTEPSEGPELTQYVVDGEENKLKNNIFRMTDYEAMSELIYDNSFVIYLSDNYDNELSLFFNIGGKSYGVFRFMKIAENKYMCKFIFNKEIKSFTIDLNEDYTYAQGRLKDILEVAECYFDTDIVYRLVDEVNPTPPAGAPPAGADVDPAEEPQPETLSGLNTKKPTPIPRPRPNKPKSRTTEPEEIPTITVNDFTLDPSAQMPVLNDEGHLFASNILPNFIQGVENYVSYDLIITYLDITNKIGYKKVKIVIFDDIYKDIESINNEIVLSQLVKIDEFGIIPCLGYCGLDFSEPNTVKVTPPYPILEKKITLNFLNDKFKADKSSSICYSNSEDYIPLWLYLQKNPKKEDYLVKEMFKDYSLFKSKLMREKEYFVFFGMYSRNSILVKVEQKVTGPSISFRLQNIKHLIVKHNSEELPKTNPFIEALESMILIEDSSVPESTSKTPPVTKDDVYKSILEMMDKVFFCMPFIFTKYLILYKKTSYSKSISELFMFHLAYGVLDESSLPKELDKKNKLLHKTPHFLKYLFDYVKEKPKNKSNFEMIFVTIYNSSIFQKKLKIKNIGPKPLTINEVSNATNFKKDIIYLRYLLSTCFDDDKKIIQEKQQHIARILSALIINLYIHAEISFKGIFRDSVTFSEETFDAQQALPPVPPAANSVKVADHKNLKKYLKSKPLIDPKVLGTITGILERNQDHINYLDRQKYLQCALHALNNFFGRENFFIGNNSDEITTLPLKGMPTITSICNMLKQVGGAYLISDPDSCDEKTEYHVSIIITFLNMLGYRCDYANSGVDAFLPWKYDQYNTSRIDATLDDPKCEGYICATNPTSISHFFAIRKVQTKGKTLFHIKDSLKQAVVIYDKANFLKYLAYYSYGYIPVYKTDNYSCQVILEIENFEKVAGDQAKKEQKDFRKKHRLTKQLLDYFSDRFFNTEKEANLHIIYFVNYLIKSVNNISTLLAVDKHLDRETNNIGSKKSTTEVLNDIVRLLIIDSETTNIDSIRFAICNIFLKGLPEEVENKILVSALPEDTKFIYFKKNSASIVVEMINNIVKIKKQKGTIDPLQVLNEIKKHIKFYFNVENESILKAVLGVTTHQQIETEIGKKIESAQSGGARKRRYKISTKKRKYKYKKLNKNTLKNPYIR